MIKNKEFEIHTFPSGIRMVHKQISGTRIAHCGFVINAGSRDESHDATGIAHFIEHMLFKGTKKRKSFAILSRMDEVGAELNAYTTREHTSLYSSFPDAYLERATELLTDLCFHSVFPLPEMVKEKKVIQEEYEMYLDSPEESIYDDFSQRLYPGHPIGRNILGTPDSIAGFNSKQMKGFMQDNYLPQHIVFGYVGRHSFTEVKQLLEKNISGLRFPVKTRTRKKPSALKPFHIRNKKSFMQAHCIMGNRAYHNRHKLRPALLLLSNYLGGPALNSRLNISVRERYGYTYNIESSYSPYSDTGIFSIYTGTDPVYLDKCISIIHKEMKALKEQSLSSAKLQAAKRQFLGQVSMGEENRSGLMLALARSLNDYDCVDTLQEIYRKIEAITSEQILEAANRVFDKNMSSLIYLPEDK